jgi:hypothetical protein
VLLDLVHLALRTPSINAPMTVPANASPVAVGLDVIEREARSSTTLVSLPTAPMSNGRDVLPLLRARPPRA